MAPITNFYRLQANYHPFDATKMAPVFPAELPPATTDPALTSAAPVAPLPLILEKTNAGAGGTPYKEPGRHRLNLKYYEF